MTATKNSDPRRGGRASLALLAATAALFSGGAALAPGHAAAMSDDSQGCVDELEAWYFLFELDTDCSEETGGGSGSSSSSGGNDPWEGWQADQSPESDLWEDWAVDQGEVPEDRWARQEREAVERYEATVKRAKNRLDEERMDILLDRMERMDKQDRAKREREGAESGSDRPRRGSARKGKGGRR